MKPLIVDASVVATAFFDEADADAAAALLASDADLHAPDLIYAELANVVWKRYGRGEVTEQDGVELLADVLRLPLLITPSAELADAALHLSMRTRRTAYDCFYLALAVRCKGVLVTGDRRLVNALAQGPLGRHIAWVGESHRA